MKILIIGLLMGSLFSRSGFAAGEVLCKRVASPDERVTLASSEEAQLLVSGMELRLRWYSIYVHRMKMMTEAATKHRGLFSKEPLRMARPEPITKEQLTEFADLSDQLEGVLTRPMSFRYNDLENVARASAIAESYLQTARDLKALQKDPILDMAVATLERVVAIRKKNFVVVPENFFSTISEKAQKEIGTQIMGDVSYLSEIAQKINDDARLVTVSGNRAVFSAIAFNDKVSMANDLILYKRVDEYCRILLSMTSIAEQAQILNPSLLEKLKRASYAITGVNNQLYSLASGQSRFSYETMKIQIAQILNRNSTPSLSSNARP